MLDLKELATYLSGRRAFIQTHNYPDADALGSAYGLQYLLSSMGVDAKIIYVGKIDKFNTQQMIKLLGIELLAAEEVSLVEDDAIILVDAQKYNSNIRDCTGDEIACIDHHEILHEPDYPFCDIRPEVGACSSIIASYFIQAGIEIPVQHATAMLYGIKMDTADLIRGMSELDIDMFYHLYKRSDMDIIRTIQLNTMEFNDLTSYAQAIEDIRVFDNISIARINGFCPDALIASIGDFMLSLIEIEVTAVYNMRNDGIKISMRSEIESCNVAQVLTLALDGIGAGGGHHSMSGGFIPQENVGPEIDAILQDRLLNAIQAQVSAANRD